jgi:predicted DCC family thiol-disulfide oxidoreductase YuxK
MKNIIFFDGDCGICSHSADWLSRRLDNQEFDIIPFDENHEVSKKLNLDIELASKTVILVKKGVIFTESLAIFEIAKSLSFPYNIFGIFANKFCSLLANPFYRLIANNRATISRKLGLQACKVRYNQDGD